MDSAEQDRPVALAAGFPAADRADWQALVAGVLAKSGVPVPPGEPPEAALTSVGYDGFQIAPLYTAADRPAGWDDRTVGPRPSWDVRARHADPDPQATNQAVLADLTNGVSSLWLVLGAAGLAVADLPTALAGVYLELAPIVLDAGDQAVPAAQALLALAGPDQLTGSLGADPIGWAARTGAPVELAQLLRLAELAADRPGLLPITVDASCYHQAGATDADELAISLAAGVAYLRALTDAGHSLATAFESMEFRYAVTANQFKSIAKLRAGRLLWGRVGELSGLPAGRQQRQHAVTSPAMLSRRDPWVNILRGTLGCFAAAVGGADAITVSPFDGALGLPDELARRIARNTQAILHDESSLARVGDPAGGSYYVEAITEQLAATAWKAFTELERDGGLVAVLETGALAERLDRSWQRRRDELAHRRAPLTGVSEFPLADEQLLTRRPAPAAPSGGLPQHRFAEPYEQLRDRSDQLAERGVRPRVFLAALGPVAAHSARLAFASNLALAGGVQPVIGTGDPDQLTVAFKASGANVGWLCSSDRVYAEQAGAAADALRTAGARQVWLAGRPELATELGLDNAIYQGCDALARLAELQELDGALG